MKLVLNYLSFVLISYGFLSIVYYGIGVELERRDNEDAYYIKKCESNSNYYPKLCSYLLGE